MRMQYFRYFKSVCLAVLLAAGASSLFAQGNKSYPASAFPDRLILGYKGSPSHSQSVNWRTDSTVTNAIAAIHDADPSPDFPSKARIVKAATHRVVIDGQTVLYHEANFADLKPSTQYVYRVGDGNHWSEWFHFQTASEKPAPVSFLYFGDAQNDIRSLWSRAVRGAFANMPKANLMIHAGDLINNSNTDFQWGEWFEAGGWINGMVPNLATPGNHEYWRDEKRNLFVSKHWKPQFALPENGPEGLSETAYYIDYQGVRFISLDSQAAILDSTTMKKQAAWFEKIASDNPNRWTVVFHHHPIYSTKQGRDNDEWRDRMEPLYKKYKVDIVLQGHDHTYGRGMNIPIGQSRKKPNGPVYVVSVSGPKMYDIGLQNWMDRAASNTQLYQAITINQNKLSFKAFTVNGDLYDEHYLKTFKQEELKEYNQRYQEYKKRKGIQ